MTIYAGHQVTLEVSAALGTPSYALVKGVRECRWRIEQLREEMPAISDDNWQRFSDTYLRRWQMNCSLYGASHTAQVQLKQAALFDSRLAMRMTLADGTQLASTDDAGLYWSGDGCGIVLYCACHAMVCSFKVRSEDS
jgi:hypothetical protein